MNVPLLSGDLELVPNGFAVNRRLQRWDAETLSPPLRIDPPLTGLAPVPID
jgi:hypothetical protein